MQRCIQLANGRRVRLSTYVQAWRALRELPAAAPVTGFDHFPTPAGEILAELRKGLHDRINRHLPGHGQGRKWSVNWQAETTRAAHQINYPRLVIDWLPPHLRERFAHRLRQSD